VNAYDEGYGVGQAEAAAELAECRSHLNMTTSMRELEQREYIHQLEGWLAEVRERSASLLEERNELRKAMRTLGNDYNALSAEHAKWQEEARSYCQNASYHRQKREQAEAEVSRLQVHEDESAERLERLTEAEAELAALKAENAGLKTAYDHCVERELSWMVRSDKAEAELAALKGRRCEGCQHYVTGCEVSMAGWSEFEVVPFSCCCWAERGPG